MPKSEKKPKKKEHYWTVLRKGKCYIVKPEDVKPGDDVIWPKTTGKAS